ncbi:Homeodomain-like protein, partial [Dioszegia hungarica]
RLWTAAEDDALKEAIRLYGSRTGAGSAWSAISRHVSIHGGRTNKKDCRKRWFYTLDPGLKKGRWTQDEDEALRKAFLEVGAQWKEMALRVPGRTDEQVAKRWRDVLSPDLVLDAPWTPEEDALLLRLFKEHGPKWTKISHSFATRNGIAVRNRFRRF